MQSAIPRPWFGKITEAVSNSGSGKTVQAAEDISMNLLKAFGGSNL